MRPALGGAAHADAGGAAEGERGSIVAAGVSSAAGKEAEGERSSGAAEGERGTQLTA